MTTVTNCGSLNEAEQVKARLTKACEGDYMNIEFLACPVGGSYDIVAQTSYDLTKDENGEPQDPEKALCSRLVFIFAYAVILWLK